MHALVSLTPGADGLTVPRYAQRSPGHRAHSGIRGRWYVHLRRSVPDADGTFGMHRSVTPHSRSGAARVLHNSSRLTNRPVEQSFLMGRWNMDGRVDTQFIKPWNNGVTSKLIGMVRVAWCSDVVAGCWARRHPVQFHRPHVRDACEGRGSAGWCGAHCCVCARDHDQRS